MIYTLKLHYENHAKSLVCKYIFFLQTIFHLRSIIWLISAPVPISTTLTPSLASIFSINSLGLDVNLEYSVRPAHSGNTTSSLVTANCVALFTLIDFLANSKLKGDALLCRPVTLPYSTQPNFAASSGLISFSKGPPPTRVTYALNTKITSSTFLGPIPTSEHIPDAVTSLEVTYG